MDSERPLQTNNQTNKFRCYLLFSGGFAGFSTPLRFFRELDVEPLYSLLVSCLSAKADGSLKFCQVLLDLGISLLLRLQSAVALARHSATRWKNRDLQTSSVKLGTLRRKSSSMSVKLPSPLTALCNLARCRSKYSRSLHQ